MEICRDCWEERGLCKCWFFFSMESSLFIYTNDTHLLFVVRRGEENGKWEEAERPDWTVWEQFEVMACMWCLQSSSHVSALSWEAAGFLPWANAWPCAFCCRLQVKSPCDVFTKGLGIPLICVGVLQNLALQSHWVQCQGSSAT